MLSLLRSAMKKNCHSFPAVVLYRVYVRVTYPRTCAWVSHAQCAQIKYSNVKKLCPWLSHAHRNYDKSLVKKH